MSPPGYPGYPPQTNSGVTHCSCIIRRTLGAVFLQQGLSAKQEGDAEEAENMLAAAAKFYKKAAEMYPPDDENFPCESG